MFEQHGAVSLAQLIESSLARASDNAGVRDINGFTPWSDVNRRAWAVAELLIVEGVKRGDVVAVLTSRTVDLAAAWLGVLRAGATYLPIDMDTPPARIAHMVSDSRSVTVLVDQDGLAQLDSNGYDFPRILLSYSQAGAPRPEWYRELDQSWGDSGCLIYTSGTTGDPKGVLLSHECLLEGARKCAWIGGYTAESSILCAVSASFDAATGDVYAAVLTGATLVLSADAQRRDPRLLARDQTGNRRFSGLLVTPTVLQLVIDADVPPGIIIDSVAVGGELVSANLAAKARRVLGAAQVVNVWGATEASIISTAFGVPSNAETLPIGTPLPEVRVYILGEHLEPTPSGAVGNLFIGGKGLADGYFGQPVATAQAFLPDPWGPPGSRMYHTGDTAWINSDGQLEFRGRVDNQVKLNGNRFELDEIAAALERSPHIKRSLVSIEAGQLVAYVESSDEFATEVDLLMGIRAWLPPAAVPTDIRVLDTVPLTSNGKVDRTRVPGLPWHRLQGGVERELDIGEQKNLQLAKAVFSKELGIGRAIGEAEDLFKLGASSIDAARIVADAAEASGAPISLAAFLRKPTPAGLAAQMAERSRPTHDEPERLSERPATSAEERFWFLNQVEGMKKAYLVPMQYEIQCAEPVRFGETIRDALDAVMDSYPALRSRFVPESDGQLKVCDGPPYITKLVTGVLEDDPTWLRDFIETPFELQTLPPIRAVVFCGISTVTVAVCAHHIAMDGLSASMFWKAVAEAHRHLAVGMPVPHRIAEAHPVSLHVVEPTRSNAYANLLLDAPSDIVLPLDRPRPEIQDTHAGTVIRRELVKARELTRLCEETGASPFMVLTAITAVALGRVTLQRDVILATPWGVRRPELSEEIGLFVETLAMRVDNRRSLTWRDAVSSARAGALDAYEYADVPFNSLLRALQPDRDLGRPPLTPVEVVYTDQDDLVPWFGPDARVKVVPSSLMRTKYEMTFEYRSTDNSVGLELHFAKSLFNNDTAESIATEVSTAASEIVSSLESTCWRRSEGTLTSLRMAASDERGDGAAEAIIADGVQWSANQLEDLTARIASEITSLQLPRQTIIPVVAARGAFMFAAWSAVMRTGNTYVPIDAESISERGPRILRSLNPTLVILDAAGARISSTLPPQVSRLSESMARTVIHTDVPRADLPRSDDLAYVMFTSGSTGAPKGVSVTHRNLYTYVSSLHDRHPELQGRRCLIASAPDVDFVATVLHATFESGGTTVIATKDESLDGAKLASLVIDHSIDVVKLTPSHLEALLATQFVDVLSTLEILVLGGEAISDGLRQQLLRLRALGTVTINHYGPTETTVGAVTHKIDLSMPGSPPMGWPLPGVAVQVLDLAGRKLAIGETGTLWISGEQVAAGYLASPVGTRNKFSQTGELSTRTYRTDDLVYLDRNGALNYVGRTDSQVKLNGRFVDLTALKEQVIANTELRRVELVVSENCLHLFAVDSGTSALTALSALFTRLFSDGPISWRLHEVSELPIAGAGKVDTRALLDRIEPLERRPAQLSASVANVVAVWEEVLGTEDLPIDLPFFDAGGGSLQMLALLARLQVFDVRIQIADLFSHSTIASQALLLSGSQGRSADRGREDDPDRRAQQSLERTSMLVKLRNQKEGRSHG